ncbi:Fur family transcriptional regulator [Variovorax sp. OV084]|jgi:Fe2+ or Zn2+ uptake regulation protein|uniref:Fur family transcriptional regulator n=1 Tax=Variovorax sp. OV084 TaxID=1882777 RepID=UPI0008AD9B57|nr:transcriptional repressor [Variovorax sp. OV084]SET77447.1 Fe2+ or Zn2+ uptake regulation protein [Variovorax sp. OV084]
MTDGPQTNDTQRPVFMSQLRAARIRPSVVRLCVLQTLADAGSEWQRGEEVFRRMLLRGTSASLTTVYRILKEFEHSGLVEREWARSRGGALAVFRYAAPGADADALSVRMRCNGCGTFTEVQDRELHEALVRVAQSKGLPLAGTFDVQIHGSCSSCEHRSTGESSSEHQSSREHGRMLPLVGFRARPRAQRLAA